MWMRAVMCGLILGLISLVTATASTEPKPTGAESNEIAFRIALRDDGARLVRQNDFRAIDAAARRYREDDIRTPSGTDALLEFYDGIDVELGHGQRKFGCVYTAGPFFEAWHRAEPQSPTPYILEAQVLSDNGWCLRGSGYASQVSKNSWETFKRQIARAENILSRNRKIAAADPAFYSTMLSIYNDSGKSESEYRAVLDEAVARYPGYMEIYFTAARHYLPQWGGSYEAVDAIARRAELELPRASAAGGYVRVYWYLLGCGCYDGKMPVDRLLLRRSMAEALVLFPNNWNVANFALIACRTGDPIAARSYFKALPPGYDPKWHDAKWWSFCRDVAGVASEAS